MLSLLERGAALYIVFFIVFFFVYLLVRRGKKSSRARTGSKEKTTSSMPTVSGGNRSHESDTAVKAGPSWVLPSVRTGERPPTLNQDTDEQSDEPMQLVAPKGGPVCNFAQRRLGRYFPRNALKHLPLAGCSMPSKCQCHYVPAPERRKIDDRRQHQERRSRVRLTNERRKNPGRRRTDEMWQE
ncbi:MAG: hypothetical protein R3202_10605 [Candidatus Competibacterales bacterium]|nr:hypothetical protein [Candidatus Competibacterales bacterium]